MNTQINEDYRFRMAYVRELLREMFGTTNVIEDANLENRIKEIEKQQDNSHIESLEKDRNTFITKKGKSSKLETEKVKVSSKDIKEQTEEMIAKELDDEDEKEL